MISMNCMGSIGRLGNQMFQYAALRSLAKKFNYEYCLPVVNSKCLDSYGNPEDLNLFECFKLNDEERKNTNLYTIKLDTLGLDENILNHCPDNVDFHGYFQDVKYFEDNAEDIRECFKFNDTHFNVAKEYFYSAFSNKEDVIALHIRRGDYALHSHHPIQTLEYYEKSLKFFHKDLKVLIFSDDIDWAYNQYFFRSDNRFFFSRNNNVAVDLCMQTFCSYHIISNSTLSWWGAWLAKSKKVIKPKLWFGPPLHNYKNFLNVQDWISLDAENPKKNYSNIEVKDKLKNFPPVNFISIEESQNRRDVLYKMFNEYEIENVTPHIYKRYRDEDHKIIEGPLVNHISKGPVTSHLKAIKEWYENTDEPYTFFCEDDFSFDTVKYWNFTWQDFFDSLPQDWNIIQLCLIREDMFIFFNPEVKLRHRFLCDWSSCAYLITRKHAENLIKNYYPDDFIHLEYKGTDKELREKEENSYWFIFPHAENIIYSPLEEVQGGIYTFPLFVENVSFKSTWSGSDDNWLNRYSHDEIVNWWETKGRNKILNDLKL